MNTKMRKELQIGMGAYALSLILKQFFAIPELIMGILMGFAICFMIVGSLQEKAYQRLKHWKKKSFVK